MTKKSVEQVPGDGLDIGNDVHGPVSIRKTADGVAVLLPTSSGPQLNSDGLEALGDLQGIVRDMKSLRDALDEAVSEARYAGAPWALIGFSVGTSGDAARKRWGSDA